MAKINEEGMINKEVRDIKLQEAVKEIPLYGQWIAGQKILKHTVRNYNTLRLKEEFLGCLS